MDCIITITHTQTLSSPSQSSSHTLYTYINTYNYTWDDDVYNVYDDNDDDDDADDDDDDDGVNDDVYDDGGDYDDGGIYMM